MDKNILADMTMQYISEIETLKKTVEKNEQILSDLKVEIDNRDQLVKELSERLSILTEQLNIRNMYAFGSPNGKIEKTDQLHFVFNETEMTIAEAGEIAEPDIKTVVPSYERTKARKRKGKRSEDLKGIPIIIEEHALSEEELEKEFPQGYRRLRDTVYKKLEYRPASFEVKEHHLAVYRDKKSDKIIRAPHPKEMIDNSVATPSLVAGIMNAKYTNAVPLRRQEAEFKRFGVNIPEQNMANWVIKTSELYLSLIYDRMKKHLLQGDLIHADETPVKVVNDGREGMHKSYMWVYRTGERFNTRHIVLYDYKKGRSADDAEEFLGRYKGTIVCDAYSVYKALEKKEETRFELAGCWAHVIRKFRDVCNANKSAETKDVKIAGIAANMISAIFNIDNELKGLPQSEILEKRQSEIRVEVERFFSWLKEHRTDVLPSGGTGKAIEYCLNQEKWLKKFLENAMIPLDNNPAERSIRPFTVGRKNWQLINTIHGAEASAIVYSLVETAKANKLKPYYYLKYLLTEIPKHIDESDTNFIDNLLPWAEAIPDECKEIE